MKCNKILSISIAAYNVEKTIRETLDSFINFDNVEVIVVDDGSSDNTAEIVNEYIELYPNIFKLIQKENAGWGSTVNIGARNASGKYFSLCDGDDHYDESLKEFLDYLNDNDSDIVLSPYRIYDEKDNKTLEIIDLKAKDLDYKRIYKLNEINAFSLAMHSIFVKRELIRDMNIQENCFYTDNEYALKVLENVKTISFYDEAIYQYRMNSDGQSVSLSGLEKHYLDQEKVLFELIDFKEKNNNKSLIKYCDSMLHDLTIWMYLIYLRMSINKKHKEDLIKFDNRLKKYPELYNMKDIPKHIKLLRLLNFNFYSLAVWSKHD